MRAEYTATLPTNPNLAIQLSLERIPNAERPPDQSLEYFSGKPLTIRTVSRLTFTT
jgi:hypothetical protein